MIEKSGTQILVGAMNLLAVASPLVASPVSHAATGGQKIEKLNAVSLRSIESTWLQVPNTCKARTFNASAVPVDQKVPGVRIQNIYASFGV